MVKNSIISAALVATGFSIIFIAGLPYLGLGFIFSGYFLALNKFAGYSLKKAEENASKGKRLFIDPSLLEQIKRHEESYILRRGAAKKEESMAA